MKCHNQAHAPPRNIFAAARPTRMVISGQGTPYGADEISGTFSAR